MSDSPKLYKYKPRKAHLKHSSFPTPSSSSTMSSSSTSPGTSGVAPPPQPPRESFVRRYKFMWPLLLAVNFTAGAYLFMRTKKNNVELPKSGDVGVPPEVQRELFKWVLEERKKMKPIDDADKKRIEDEIAVLNSFINNKSSLEL